MPLANLNEVDIYYDRKGKGELPYVFCHGLGSNSIRFGRRERRMVFRNFRRGFRERLRPREISVFQEIFLAVVCEGLKKFT